MGDCRARGGDAGAKRRGAQGLGSPRDWGRRQRAGAPNATAGEADGRLRAAEQRKQLGGRLVAQADWTEALEEYQAALRELHFQAPNAEAHREHQELTNACHLSCALCYLMLEEHAAAAEACTKVIESDRSSVKARLRRATALGAMSEFEGALADAEQRTTLQHLRRLQCRALSPGHSPAPSRALFGGGRPGTGRGHDSGGFGSLLLLLT